MELWWLNCTAGAEMPRVTPSLRPVRKQSSQIVLSLHERVQQLQVNGECCAQETAVFVSENVMVGHLGNLSKVCITKCNNKPAAGSDIALLSNLCSQG